MMTRDKTMFYNTTPDQQDQDQKEDRFFGLNQTCPKTNGLRPHHWYLVTFVDIYRRREGIWPSVDKSGQGGRGLIFAVFLWTSFMDDPLVELGVVR